MKISNGITQIEEYVFQGCTSLTSIDISDNVTEINRCAFLDCTSLVVIHLPDSITTIGERAFYNCKSLTNIVIPKKVVKIDWDTFYNCVSLISVEFISTTIEIAGNAFKKCDSLKKVILPTRNCNIDTSVFPNAAEIVYRDELDKKSVSEPQPMFNGMELSEEEMALILKLRSDKQKAQEQEQNIRSEFSKTDDEYTAINSPLVLKDCSRIISNNIFTLRFSCASGASQYSDSEYEIFLTDENGNAVSSIVKYEEEPSRIEFAPQFELNSGVTFNKNEDYYLTITELNNEKSSIVSKNEFHVDITFSQDFDF